MRSLRFGLVLLLLAAAKNAGAQAPGGAAPAVEPASAAQDAPAPEPGVSAPEAAPDPATAPESAAASEKAPESAGAAPEPPPDPIGRAPEVAPTDRRTEAPSLAPWIRAHEPLTLEARLGLLVRPESSAGFDEETHVGADLGLSVYLDLNRQLAAGLELERASLGRGSAISGQTSVSSDFTVTSAMLGVRAYPKRTAMFDFYVGLQLGVGVQSVSAAGTASVGPLAPARPYACSATDGPGFQLGGGVGARLMISPRWGISGRINGSGRRLSGELIDDCARGIGTATTVSASLGLGYDFDLEP